MDTNALKALADDNRLAIIRELARGELCSCELAEALGISEALVSHHVKRLREAGLVRTRRVGRWQHCRIQTDRIDELGSQMRELAAAAEGAPQASGKGCLELRSRETEKQRR